MKPVLSIVLFVLLMALDQAFLGSACSQTPDPPADRSEVDFERVDAAGLRRFLATGQYLQLPPDIAEQVNSLAGRPEVPRAVSERPRFRRADCEAVFDGQALIQGRMTLTIDDSALSAAETPLLIGTTNLSQFRFSDGRNRLVPGVDDNGQLYVLQAAPGVDVHATWKAVGQIAGDLVTFRLELPRAMTSRMELTTAAEFVVSSSNGLVLGPWPEGDLRRWDIIPSAAARLTVSCRKQRPELAGTPISFSGLEAFHTMTPDGLASRWTMRLPDEFPQNSRLEVHLPADVRVSDVLINDQRPLEWTTTAVAAGMQELNLNLSGNPRRSTVSMQATTVQPVSGTWELPLLTPVRWVRPAAGTSGPIVLPVSQISLTVPASTDLLGWELQGIEERDVVAGPDNSRVYQLTRFTVGGRAVAQTSLRNPAISEEIAAVIGSSGRLISARCIVAVTSDQGAVLQLSWPVTAGWEVMAVRNAVSGKSLFCETRHAAAETAQGIVTVHLPEPLDARSHHLLEFQLQQSELTEDVASAAALAELPLQPGLAMQRTSGRLVVLPSLAAFRHEAGLRSPSLRPVNLALIRQQFPVLSGAAIPEDASAFDVVTPDRQGSAESPPERSTRPSEVLLQNEADSGLAGFPAAAPTEPGDGGALIESATAEHDHSGISPAEDGADFPDVEVFHLVDRTTRGVRHECLAVAHLRQIGSADSLPVTLPPGLFPVAEVNGHRVQLVTSANQIQIPLPQDANSCVVVLRWSVAVPESLWSATTGLTVPFSPSVPFRFCTHQLLISPELIPSFEDYPDQTVIRFTSANATASSAAPPMSRLPEFVGSGRRTASRSPEPARGQGVSESFVKRWALLSGLGWQIRTLALRGSVSPRIPLRMEYERPGKALQVSILTVVAVGCWLGRRMVARHSRVLAIVTIVVGSIPVTTAWFPLDAARNGLFRGLMIGMLLALIGLRLSGWRVRAQSLSRSSVAGSVIALVITCGTTVASAQVPAGDPADAAVEDPGPDVLIMENSGLGEDLTFVQKSLYARWENERQLASRQNPAVVVTALTIQVVAENFDAVEAVLTMDLAVRASARPCRFSVPLQDARPVACQVDGQPALPSTSAADRLEVLIPPVTQVAPTSLRSEVGNFGAVGSHPGPPPGWDRRRVVLSIRPRTVRHTGGLTFRLPAVPVPSVEFQIESVGEFVTRAIVRANDRVQSWSPEFGPMTIDGFSAADALSVMLLTSGEQRDGGAVPEPAEIELFAICEMLSGQPLLTCVYRIRGWNPLSHEVSLPIPAGYRVVGLTSSIGEQAWTVRGSSVDVQLPEFDGSEFSLELKLLASAAQEPLTHVVPLDPLGRVPGCRAPQRVLVAVRTTPDLSVRRNQAGDQDVPAATPLPLSDTPAAVGFWLRRQDVVFELPPDTPTATFRLVPRTSHSEVQVQQSVVCHELGADWTYQADVETAVLRLFRHRIRIAPAIEVSDVQVLSGEANRLDKWHRDGDQLIILLKEGTSGLHRLIIKGTQRISTVEEEISLLAPQLQEVQVLESLLTVSGTGLTGFTLSDAGGAQPDQRLLPADVLESGTSWRFHVVDETLPVVLRRRRRPVVDGSAAVFRDHDRAFVLMQLQNVPPGRDAQRLSLPPDIAFLKPPTVLLDSRSLPIERVGNEFRWSAATENAVPRELTVGWTLPLPATPDVTPVVALPEFPFDVNWHSVLINVEPASAELTTGVKPQPDVAGAPQAEAVIPAWLSDAAVAFEIPEVSADTLFRSLPAQDAAKAGSVRLPALPRPAVTEPGPQSRRFVISDTVAFIPSGETAAAQTLLIVCGGVLREPLRIQVPAGIVITQIESPAAAHWDGPDRTSLVLHLTERLTRIRIRWFVDKTPLSVFYATHALRPPEPAECQVQSGLTLLTSTRIGNSVVGGRRSQSATEFSGQVGTWIREGLNQATRSAAGTSSDQPRLPAATELSAQFELARQEFLTTVAGEGDRNTDRQQFFLDRSDSPLEREPSSPRPPSPGLTVTSFQFPDTSSVVTWPAALLLLVIAFMRRSDSHRTHAATPLH